MSNTAPTLEEIKYVVDKINNAYDNVQLKNERLIPDFFVVCSIEIVYDVVYIKVLGQIIWGTDNDYRPNIDEDHQEYEEGVDKPISLEDHILSELMGITLGVDGLLDELTLGSNNQEDSVWKTITTYH